MTYVISHHHNLLILQHPHDHHHHHMSKHHTMTYTTVENGDMLDEVRQKIAQIKKAHHKPSSLVGTPLQASSQTSITQKGIGTLFTTIENV